MSIELYRFTIWSLHPFHWIKVLYWVLRKGLCRFQQNLTGRFNTSNYPPKILEFFNVVRKSTPEVFIEKFDRYKTKLVYELPENIDLSSEGLQIFNGVIDWFHPYPDPEDEESLHRWNWMLKLASNKRFSPEKLLWLLAMQEDWVHNFQQEVHLPNSKLNKLLRWESYTVGERIANSILLSQCKDITLSPIVRKAIIEQVQLLMTRLEYFGSQTGNHVFNNSRAIYLAGSFFKCEPWCKFAEMIMRRELPRLVTSDGFLREGSSHYQFLFTRWVLEVLFFVELFENQSLKTFLVPFVEKLLDKCSFFYSSVQPEIPLFGDISPDFSPEWLISLIENTVDKNNKYTYLGDCSWNRLWDEKNNPYSSINTPSLTQYHNVDISSFSESGWYRFNRNEYTLFMHIEPKGFPTHVGHHHHDAGNFCLYHKNYPLIVDSGRLNYFDLFGVSSKAHNTITLNDLGLIPENPGRYPRAYSTCNNFTNSTYKNDDLQVFFESDGFNRISANLVWKRYLNLGLEKFSIQDELAGRGEYVMKAYFHFDSEIKLKEEQKSKYSLELKDKTASFFIDLKGEFRINTYYGDDSPLGWQYLAYGKRVPAYTLEIVRKVNLPEIINYSLIWV